MITTASKKLGAVLFYLCIFVSLIAIMFFLFSPLTFVRGVLFIWDKVITLRKTLKYEKFRRVYRSFNYLRNNHDYYACIRILCVFI